MSFSTNCGSLLSLNVCDQMRLEPVGLPDAVDHRVARAQFLGQRPRAPVRGVRRCLVLRGPFDDPLGPAHCDGLTTAPRRIFLDARQTLFGESFPPAAHRGWLRAKRFSDLLVPFALGRHKDHPGPLHQSHRRASSPSPPLESRTLFVRDRDLRSYTHCVHPFLLQRKTQYKSDNYIYLSNTTLARDEGWRRKFVASIVRKPSSGRKALPMMMRRSALVDASNASSIK